LSLPPAVAFGSAVAHRGHILLELRLIQRLQLGLRLLTAHAGLQSPVELKNVRAARVERRPVRHHLRQHHRWNEDVDRSPDFQPVEAALGDADHGERMTADANRLTHDIRPAAEARRPESVRQHHDRMAAPHAIVRLRQQPARERPHAQHVEVIAADDARGRASSGAVDHEVHGIGAFREEAREDLLAVAEAEVRGIRPGHGACRPSVPHSGGIEQHELARMFDGQRFQQQLVDDAEDRRVGPDA